MKDEELKLGTVNIAAEYKEPDGREGVVLLADSQVSRGNLGQTLPDSYKVRAVSSNISMSLAGSAGDAQALAEAVQSIVTDNEELYFKAVDYLSKPQTLSKSEMEKLHEEQYAEDLISGNAEKFDELRKEFASLKALLKSDPADATKQEHAKRLETKMTDFEKNYSAAITRKAVREIKKKSDAADKFFDPSIAEFQLDVRMKPKSDERYVRRLLPIEKMSWGGDKIFPTVGAVFQRVNSADGEDIAPTVDGTAKLAGDICRSRRGLMSYDGIVAGISPFGGAMLYEVEGGGAVVKAKTWTATGSGSVHISAELKKESKKLLKGKEFLTRDDALGLAFEGATYAIEMDNYVGPPLNVVLIERDNNSDKTVSYKITVDVNEGNGSIVVPECLKMEVLAREYGKDTSYQATIGADGKTTIYKLPEPSRHGEPTKIEDPKLTGKVKSIAGSCFKVMEKYSVG